MTSTPTSPSAPGTDPSSARRWAFLERPGVWFWALIVVGALARGFLAIETKGTADVVLWTEHASGAAEQGVHGHYASDPQYNHPPFMGAVMAWLYVRSTALGLDFRVVYRLLVGLADLASVALIVSILRESRWRWVAGGLYAMAPIALVLSAHHGNTDPLIGLCLLGCTLLAGSGRPVWTGVLLGFSAWIKLPGLFAAPVFGFVFPRWRDRFACAGVATAVAASLYVPAWFAAEAYVASHPNAALPGGGNLLWERVFLYRGVYIHAAGDPTCWIWGLKILISQRWGYEWPNWALRWIEHNVAITYGTMFLFAYLRRRERSAPEIAVTVAGVFAIFYALAETWTFQYFAWSMPFWMLAGRPYALTSNLLGGGYVYVLYAYFCDDWLLRPKWAYFEHPFWPSLVLWLRDLAWLSFLAFALFWLGQALAREVGWRRRRHRERAAAGA